MSLSGVEGGGKMKEWIVSNPVFDSDELNKELAVSPWNGHRNFAYDYISFFQPSQMIELGTHYGCSFFSMCQALKDHNLQNKLYAVDTWQGDEQAGYYDNSVWELVQKTKSIMYPEVNAVFLKMLFQEAVLRFDDESFDLIHIDGLHTYEAVSKDFITWLPKLKKDGVIFFHDVNSGKQREQKYGTDSFWEDVKKEVQGR